MHSIRLTEIHTAKEWGMTPSQFRKLDWEDKAEMIAHDRVVDKMQQYDAEQYARKLKAKDLAHKLKHGK